MITRGIRPTEPVSTEELFRAHAPFVARLLTRLGVWSAELDDAVQEVFLVVHRNGGYKPGPATPTGYLASVAVRAASTHRRRGRKTRARQSDLVPDEVTSAGLDPARSLEVRQSLAELQDALDELDPDMRATLVLAELEGESCPSIAASMQIAVGTVYWRLHRARKSFRDAIANRRVAERRAEGLAAGALLFERSADRLLDAGRGHPDVNFDAEPALERLRAALRTGASIPPWAGAATPAAFPGGVGAMAPGVLSALVLVHLVGSGVSHWRAATASNPQLVHATAVANGASTAPTLPAEGVAEVAQPVSWSAPPTNEVPTPNRSPAREPSPRADVPLATHRTPMQPSLASPQSVLAPAPTPSDSAAPGAQGAALDPSSPDAMREIQELATARHLLESDPVRALAVARAGEAHFPTGYLREERRYVGVVALFKLGRVDEARSEAARFLADYPDGPFSARVRAAR